MKHVTKLNNLIAKVFPMYLNWVSPGSVKNATKDCQASLCGVLCNQGALCAALLPEFTHKKGSLWLAETAALRQLALAGCNVDRAFTLCFSEKVNLPQFQFLFCVCNSVSSC